MKTTLKLTLVLALIIFVACGKKGGGSVTPVSLQGDGRSSRSIDQLGSGKAYPISNYFLMPTSYASYPVGDGRTAKIGIYSQIRVLFPKVKDPKAVTPQTSEKPKVSTVAAVAATTSTPGKPAAAPPKVVIPSKPVDKTYYVFYEEWATCSDGPLGKLQNSNVLINHSAPTGTIKFSGWPVTIPNVGTLSKKGTGKASSFTLAFDDTDKDLKKIDVNLHLWNSTSDLAFLIAKHTNFGTVISQAEQAKRLKSLAKECADANITSDFVDNVRPVDTSDLVDKDTQQRQQQQQQRLLLGHDKENQSQPNDNKDFKTAPEDADNA